MQKAPNGDRMEGVHSEMMPVDGRTAGDIAVASMALNAGNRTASLARSGNVPQELIGNRARPRCFVDVGEMDQQRKPPPRPQPASGDGLDASTRSSDEQTTEDEGSSQKKCRRKERPNLRKGKWTVEEEEYTSRIIHYFSTGLLTLPEGATLRSYLAEKLNCDPMRITKKYAGASCLGRRVYHFRDRAHPTVAEIQLAKAELDHLEHRYRMRVEEGHSMPSIPSVSPATNMMLSLTQQASQLMANPVNLANAFQSWLLTLAASAVTAPVINPPAPSLSAPAPSPWNNPGLNSMKNPWLLPTAPSPAITVQPPRLDQSLQSANSALLNLMLVQAAAASVASAPQQPVPNYGRIAPSNLIPQLASNAGQGLIQLLPEVKNEPKENDAARELREAFERHLKAQAQAAQAPQPLASAQGMKSQPVACAPNAKLDPVANINLWVSQQRSSSKPPPKPTPVSMAPKQNEKLSVRETKPTPKNENSISVEPASAAKPRTEEDQAAGTILMGFLSSLRQSYENAIKDKQQGEATYGKTPPRSLRETEARSNDFVSAAQKRALSETDGNGSSDDTNFCQPATVTDASSQQVESSVEDSDWNSDKKTDPSSSEDSDKEIHGRYSRGPPRKRLKSKNWNRPAF